MNITILSRAQLREVLEMTPVIAGVEAVYRLKAEGKTAVWPLVEHHFSEKNAVMDIRSGGVFGEIGLHGLKMLNNFPGNAASGLPTFTGMLMVFDSDTGLPLGVMDASYITCMRTGAAGAIGARALARPDADTLFLLGAGKQAIFQLAASLTAMPRLKRVYIAAPRHPERAVSFCSEAPARLLQDFGLATEEVCFLPVTDMPAALAESGIVITATPAREPVIRREWICPGTHLSCIGADMVGKEELEPELTAAARVYCDDVEQCLRVGESEIPAKLGLLTRESVAGEIGQLLTGQIPGRQSEDEITLFDATGLALLDLVTAKSAIELAAQKGIGTIVEI